MDALDRYIESHSEQPSELLLELERETYLSAINPRMISGRVQGKFLEMIVRMIRPKSILEIGTFTGYSALCMAAGLEEDGRIDTLEADEELEPIIRRYFSRSPFGHLIDLHIGPALETMPGLGKSYDLVFIDADKREYTEYYESLFDNSLVHSGTFILADNILWYDKVVEEAKRRDRQTIGIQEFNDAVLADPRVENVIVPVRDGINLIRVL